MAFPRSSGLLLHPTSLPGPYGIGDLGSSAYSFLDTLARAGQRVWQMLPLGPTGYGDSPYQCFSAFAGNPLLISLDDLVSRGLLRDEEVQPARELPWQDVQYGRVIAHRKPLWMRALERFDASAPPAARAEFDRFLATNRAWLDDYALFMALKDAHDHVAWTKWPADVAHRDPAALDRWRNERRQEIRAHAFAQFVFFDQWDRLRARARTYNIAFMGDLPIFVAHDSADVWARRDLFRLHDDGSPEVVAGVPPDYFSATGQLWGNPHYRWDRLADEKYAWWIDRFRASLALVDRVRVDHFRGFEAAWEVAGGKTTAIEGEWVKGPGAALFEAAREALGPLPFVAENLGVITPEVEALREEFNFPGMAILQFAFGTDPQAPDFKPHNYPRNRVAYTGTHDNDTTVGWWTSGIGHSTRSAADLAEERAFTLRYLGFDGGGARGAQAPGTALSARRDERRDAEFGAGAADGAGIEIHWEFIRAVMASVADSAIIPVQDVLGLGSEARMNEPGTASGNWRWRLAPDALTPAIAQRLGTLAETYDRV